MTYQISIRDSSSLESAATELHDADFRIEHVIYCEQSRIFSIVGEHPGLPSAGSNLKWQPFELIVWNAVACDIEITEDVDIYEISTIRMPDASTLVIDTHYACCITLSIESLDATLTVGEDVGTPGPPQ